MTQFWEQTLLQILYLFHFVLGQSASLAFTHDPNLPILRSGMILVSNKDVDLVEPSGSWFFQVCLLNRRCFWNITNSFVSNLSDLSRFVLIISLGKGIGFVSRDRNLWRFSNNCAHRQHTPNGCYRRDYGLRKDWNKWASICSVSIYVSSRVRYAWPADFIPRREKQRHRHCNTSVSHK